MTDYGPIGPYKCSCGESHTFFGQIQLTGLASDSKAREIEGLHRRYCGVLGEIGFRGNDIPAIVRGVWGYLPESSSVVPSGGPMRELSVTCGSCCPSQGPFSRGELIHVCDLCGRGFGAMTGDEGKQTCLQDHRRVDHRRHISFLELFARRREAKMVALGVPRTELAANDSDWQSRFTQLSVEFKAMKLKYDSIIAEITDLDDCYDRMLEVPEVATTMCQFGVENSKDLQELDFVDIAQLAEPLSKVLRNKFLRVLGFRRADEETTRNADGQSC